MEPIHSAIRYADRYEHDGVGYHLEILTIDGRTTVVSVSARESEWEPRLLTVFNPGGDDHDKPIFINPYQVISVTISWT